MPEFPRCALCRKPIRAGQHFAFRPDHRPVHARCAAAVAEPGTLRCRPQGPAAGQGGPRGLGPPDPEVEPEGPPLPSTPGRERIAVFLARAARRARARENAERLKLRARMTREEASIVRAVTRILRAQVAAALPGVAG